MAATLLGLRRWWSRAWPAPTQPDGPHPVHPAIRKRPSQPVGAAHGRDLLGAPALVVAGMARSYRDARRDLTDRCATLTAGGRAKRRNRPQPLVTGLSSASQTSRPPARL